jgi:hypothetical protein
MATIDKIERAVTNLPSELATFRAWFEAFDAKRLDQAIERDARSGKLDRLARKHLLRIGRGKPASDEACGEPGVLGGL